MRKIEEIPIPCNKKPIFIDYSKINEDSRKRLRYLRALIKLADSKEDIVHYEDLGLDPEEFEQFKQYLDERYSGQFRTYKKTVNKDDFDGKIICNIDLLIDDIFEILPQNQIEGELMETITENREKISSKEESTGISREDIDRQKVDSAKTLNKFLIEIFETGISLAETQVFVDKVLKETRPEEVEAIFSFSSLSREIGKIPIKIKNKDTNFENEVLFKKIILRIISKFSAKLSNKQYWEHLSKDINNYFLKILERCDQQQLELMTESGKKYNVTINEVILNNDIKIFLAKQGTFGENPRNPVISEYQNKKALFNDKCDLSKKITTGTIVLAEIAGEFDTYTIINPLKILTGCETSKLLSLGVEGNPSNEKILSKISEVNE